MTAARSQKQAFAASLADVKRQLKAARRQEADAKKRLQAQWKLAPEGDDGAVSVQSLPEFSKVALILYDRAGSRPEAAAAYLLGEAAKRGWELRPEESVRGLVRELFLKVVLPEYVALCDLQSTSDFLAMGVALRFWEEWALVSWAKDANHRLGVAPSTEAILARKEQLRQELPGDWRRESTGTAESVKARSWCLRWRRRHGARVGVIRPRDDVTPEELRDKVPLC